MSATYEFADFKVDPGEATLTRRGYTVPLQDQPFRLLTLLLSRAGTVVTRDEIQAHLWPGNTYVEFDKSLRVAVSKLREALRDSATEPVYIETLPRRGYRFIAPVRVVEPEPAALPSVAASVATAPSMQPAAPEPPPSSDGAARFESDVRPRSRFRIALWIGLAAMLAAVPVYLWRAQVKRAIAPAVDARPVGRRSVAVIGLRNLGGSPEDRWMSTALAEMLSTELAASDRLRVVSGEEVARAGLAEAPSNTPSHESLARFGRQLGADTILFGSYTVTRQHGSAPPQMRLDLRLENLASDAPPVAVVETGPATDLFALVSLGGAEMRGRLGLEDLAASAAAAVKKSLPENPAAAQLYSEGLEKLRNFDLPAARELFQKALRIEPGHAGSHLALANTWHAMGYEIEARTEAEAAVKLAAGLTRQELLNMQGEVAQFSSDWPKATEIYKSLVTFYPDNIDYGLRLAQVQASASDAAGALVTVRKMLQERLASVDEARVDLALAGADLHVSDFQGAVDAADHACQIGRQLDRKQICARGLWIKASGLERLGKYPESLAASSEAQALYHEAGDKQGLGFATLTSGDVLYDQARTADARKSFLQAMALFEEIGHRRNAGISMERVGNTFFDEGALAESRRYYQMASEAYSDVHWDEGIPSIVGNIANVQDAEGDMAGALKSNAQGLALFEKFTDKRGMASTLANMGTIEMERGDLDKAGKDFDHAMEIDRQIAYARGLAFSSIGRGDVLLARNDVSGAIRQYEEALKAMQGIDEPSVLAVAKGSLGQALLEANQRQQAADQLQQAAGLAAQAKDHAIATMVLAELARTQLELGHTADALSAANRAVAESRLQFGPGLRAVADLALGRVFFAQRNAAAARERIRSVVEAARHYGYGPLEMEARILEARTLTSAAERGRQLDSLAREADLRGWKLLAASARKPQA